MKLRIFYDLVRLYDRFGYRRLYIHLTGKPPLFAALLQFYDRYVAPVDFNTSNPDLTLAMHDDLVKILITHFSEVKSYLLSYLRNLILNLLHSVNIDIDKLAELVNFKSQLTPETMIKILSDKNLFAIWHTIMQDKSKVELNDTHALFSKSEEVYRYLNPIISALSAAGQFDKDILEALLNSNQLKTLSEICNRFKGSMAYVFKILLSHPNPGFMLRVPASDDRYLSVIFQSLSQQGKLDARSIEAVIGAGDAHAFKHNLKNLLPLWDRIVHHWYPAELLKAINSLPAQLITADNYLVLLACDDCQRFRAVHTVYKHLGNNQNTFNGLMTHPKPTELGDAISFMHSTYSYDLGASDAIAKEENALVNSPRPEELALALSMKEKMEQNQEYRQYILESNHPVGLLDALCHLRKAEAEINITHLIHHPDPYSLARAIVGLKWIGKCDEHYHQLLTFKDPLEYARMLRDLSTVKLSENNLFSGKEDGGSGSHLAPLATGATTEVATGTYNPGPQA